MECPRDHDLDSCSIGRRNRRLAALSHTGIHELSSLMSGLNLALQSLAFELDESFGPEQREALELASRNAAEIARLLPEYARLERFLERPADVDATSAID